MLELLGSYEVVDFEISVLVTVKLYSNQQMIVSTCMNFTQRMAHFFLFSKAFPALFTACKSSCELNQKILEVIQAR